MSISERLVNDFKLEAQATRRVLEALPEDGFDWQPHEKSYTLGTLASHIAEAPSWVDSMMEDELDFAAMAEGDYTPFVAGSTAELLETLERNAKGFEAALTGRDDEFQSSEWTMRRGEKILLSLPRHAAIRSIILRHIVHHRGQITVYLRLMGVPVPPTFGPTADFPDL